STSAERQARAPVKHAHKPRRRAARQSMTLGVGREAAMADEQNVSGKVVLITGASHGLGRALAEAFARGRARVALCARGGAELAAGAECRGASGAEVVWRAADVRDERGIDALAGAAEGRWGPVTVLLNDASIVGARVPLAQYPIPTWRDVLD